MVNRRSRRIPLPPLSPLHRHLRSPPSRLLFAAARRALQGAAVHPYVAHAFSTSRASTRRQRRLPSSPRRSRTSRSGSPDDSPRVRRAPQHGVQHLEECGEREDPPLRLVSIGEGFTSYSSAPPRRRGRDARRQRRREAGRARAEPRHRRRGDGGGSRVGRGADDATAEAQEQLVDLLLSANGSCVQELIGGGGDPDRRGGARGDPGHRPPPSRRARLLLRAPTARRQHGGAAPDSGPLKALQDAALAPANALNEIAEVMPTLAAQNATDEATLKGFGSGESVAPALEGDDDGAAAKAAAAAGSRCRAPAVSSAASRVSPALTELSDPNSRLRHRLPMVGTLSRRLAPPSSAASPPASRRTRRNWRPGLARSVAERAAAAERSIADLLEPEPVARK